MLDQGSTCSASLVLLLALVRVVAVSLSTSDPAAHMIWMFLMTGPATGGLVALLGHRCWTAHDAGWRRSLYILSD